MRPRGPDTGEEKLVNHDATDPIAEIGVLLATRVGE